MIELITTPVFSDTSPAIPCRWVATECPVPFTFWRKDFGVVATADSSGYIRLHLSALFTGNNGDIVALYDESTEAALVGTVTESATAYYITTDIPYSSAYNIGHVNDNTLKTNYYLQARLTINDVIQSITLVASPNAKGEVTLDVSGLLRISTSTQKDGDYSTMLMAEPSKSGKFTMEYKECWVGSDEAYTAEGNTWYYAEVVRSEEQGCNLHDYVPNGVDEGAFLNSFERPIYFAGLPFDLSFILPEGTTSATVKIKTYTASNVLLSTTEEYVVTGSIDGRVCSVNIDPDGIEANADHFTVEIE